MKSKLIKTLAYLTLVLSMPVMALISVIYVTTSTLKDPKISSNDHTRVIWVGIDGLAANVWKTSKTPNIEKLLTNSNYSLDAQDIMPSKTYPNWTALFTSMKPIKTGIGSNPGSIFDAKLIKKPTKWNDNGNGVAYSIFDAIKDQTKLKTSFIYPLAKDLNLSKIINPKSIDDLYFAKTSIIAGSSKWNSLSKEAANKEMSASSTIAYISSELTDGISISHAGDMLINGKSDFIFSYVTGLDIRGHAFGWGSQEYLSYMKKIDGYIGRLITRIKKYNSFKNTIFVLTSDHGGVIGENTHGKNTPDERTVPIIIHNGESNIANNLGNISNLDVAPTLANLLKISACKDWEGNKLDLK